MLAILGLFVLTALSVAPTSHSALVPYANQTQCLTSSLGNSNGSAIILFPCTQDLASQAVVNTTLGQLTMYNGTMCFDVTRGVDRDGTQVQLWQCFPGSRKQLWAVNYNNDTVTWLGHNKCLDLAENSYDPYNRVQVRTCEQGRQSQGFVITNETQSS
ncbi:hypothetical protein PIIN_04393 [Serendipita indica DSM 11827]|uniref:Ricin B lectin domain-containing protein n=1 Tax=Serendipita indica (strain DSM 11827) TaxID=1109443 RepID=G4TGK6_SERID|nr:hypothetical protein PIIN_04393 [Serendipita indica DSM 11827]